MLSLVTYDEDEEECTLIEDLPWHFRDLKVITPPTEEGRNYLSIEDEKSVILLEESMKSHFLSFARNKETDSVEKVCKLLFFAVIAALLGLAVLAN